MKVIVPLILVGFLAQVAHFGTSVFGLHSLFGIWIPYLAFTVFLLGFVYKILDWAKSPVPFSIVTTAGQGKSLDWIPANNIEAPNNTMGVVIRMALEVLFFRSLFRGTKAHMSEGPRLTYTSDKALWLGGMVFHWSMLIILLRHYRFFVDPVPGFVTFLEAIDGFFEIIVHNPMHNVTLPGLFVTDLLILAAVGFLLSRRLLDTKVKFMSLMQDYFPLFMIIAISLTGIQMRYMTKVDVVGVKNLIQSVTHFAPDSSITVGSIFYVHIFLVSIFAMYFPFSKLMHAGGVFFSPTRNMKNNTREVRHINPWNPDIKIRTYMEFEDDYRDKMKAAGLPLEVEPAPKPSPKSEPTTEKKDE